MRRALRAASFHASISARLMYGVFHLKDARQRTLSLSGTYSMLRSYQCVDISAGVAYSAVYPLGTEIVMSAAASSANGILAS